MLLLIVSLKLLSELGLLALSGRWVLRAWLHRLHPHAISGNVFLALLDTVCRPWLWLAKVLSPRIVLPQHHPLVAGCLLCMLWLASTIAKIGVCVQQGLETCR